jgi:hypothetical protein
VAQVSDHEAGRWLNWSFGPGREATSTEAGTCLSGERAAKTLTCCSGAGEELGLGFTLGAGWREELCVCLSLSQA